jgi:hypothetical protein
VYPRDVTPVTGKSPDCRNLSRLGLSSKHAPTRDEQQSLTGSSAAVESVLGVDSMIPDFDEHGYLPAGVHPASLAEIEARFGQQSEVRQVQMESLRWLVELARRAGVRRLIINGSFVTERLEPNDVDCVLLAEPGPSRDAAASHEILGGLPFLQVAVIGQDDFDFMVDTVFATDRKSTPKGVVEVRL